MGKPRKEKDWTSTTLLRVFCCIASLNGKSKFISVSYTHLAVYKRQAFGAFIGKSEQEIIGKDEVELFQLSGNAAQKFMDDDL